METAGAGPLLTQLASCISKLDADFNASGGSEPIFDSNEHLQEFWLVLERVMLHRCKSKTYWKYFVRCLESSSTVLQQAAALPTNRTSVGKGRAFLVLSLHTKTLAEHIQVAVMDAKATQQHYHRDAIMRNKQSQARLLDMLYNLNVIDFHLENKVSLDDGWPSFAARSFTPTVSSPLRPSAMRGGGMDVTSLNASFEAMSVMSAMSVATSINSAVTAALEGDLDRLRQEKGLLEAEKSELQQDKVDQDAAWNKVVDRLKAKNLKLRDTISELEAELDAAHAATAAAASATATKGEGGPPSSASSLSQNAADKEAASVAAAAAAAAEKAAGAAQERVTELEARLAASAPSDQVTALQAAHAKELEQQREAAAALASENTRLGAELAAAAESETRRREELEARIRQLQVAAEATAQRLIEAEENRMHTAQQHATEMARLESNKSAEIDTLKTLHASVQRVVSDVTSQLQAAERGRAASSAQLAVLEQNLASEQERAGKLEEQVTLLRTTVKKLTDDKLTYWSKCYTLSQAIQTFAATASATWQPDSSVKQCKKCSNNFSFTLRRHHCRLCGNIFCKECASSFAHLAGSKKTVRVCTTCDSLLHSSAQSEFEVETSTIAKKLGTPLPQDGGGRGNAGGANEINEEVKAAAATASATASAAAATPATRSTVDGEE